MGAQPGHTFRRVIMPLAFPAIVAGSIFTFSLTLGDFITPELVGSAAPSSSGLGRLRQLREQPAARRGVHDGADHRDDHLPADRQAPGGVRAPVTMRLSARQLFLLRLAAGAVLAFIYVPLIIIGIEAFNEARTLKWPPPGFTHGVVRAGVREHRSAGRFPLLAEDRRDRHRRSRSCSAPSRRSGSSRYRFFGRETDLLPRHPADRAPGHRHRDRAQFDVHRGPWDRPQPADAGDRPRDVLHRRRLQQRDRPAAAVVDLVRGGVRRPRGDAVADRPLVTLPNMRTRAGRRRAAGFRTVFRRDHRHRVHDRGRRGDAADWLLNNFSRPQQLPIVNVVAVIVILLSIIPVYLAHKLSSEVGTTAGAPAAAAAATNPEP